MRPDSRVAMKFYISLIQNSKIETDATQNFCPECVLIQDRGSESDATASVCVCTKPGQRSKCSGCVQRLTEAVNLMIQ